MLVRTKLKEIMKERNITQTQLSEMSGIRQGAISEMVRDIKDTINKRHLAKIMAALEITDFNEILERVDDE